MHDPQTVAFEIYLGPKKNKKGQYKNPLITIWHCDPETDGTDDSCGWFIRKRHIDKDIVEKVTKEFEFQFKNNYWFNDGGYPNFSTMGVALQMYSTAAWHIFMYQNDGKVDRKKHSWFMRKYLFDILSFAENPTDSIGDSITMKYGIEKKEERINHFVSIVTADIFRKLRPWYKHPKWHINHWKIQFHPFERLKRKYWDKCSRCGKRGFNGPAYANWSGTEKWHAHCNDIENIPVPSTKK